MLGSHTAIYMSPGFSLAVNCGGWVTAVCVLMVCLGPCNVMLGVVPVWDKLFFFCCFFLGGGA